MTQWWARGIGFDLYDLAGLNLLPSLEPGVLKLPPTKPLYLPGLVFQLLLPWLHSFLEK